MDLLDQIAVWLPILLVVLLAAAILLSPNRRRTVLRTAIWIAFGMALLLALFNVGRTFYLDAVTDAGANRDAAAAAYDQILGFLRLSARTAFVVAVVVAIGAWLAGPGRFATRIREGVKRIGEGGEGFEQSSFGRFVARYRMALRVIIIGVALVVLVVMNQVTPLTVIVLAVIVIVLLVLVEFLSRAAPKDDGDGGGSGGASGGASPAPAAKRPAPMKVSATKKST